MTKRMRRRCVFAVLVPLLLGASAATAQDAAVVNAKTIRVVLENEQVRVLEAVLEPGDREEPHSHPASVYYVVAGGRVRNHAADGSTRESDVVAGSAVYRDPVTHWVENIGTTTIRIVLVELKPPAAPAPGAP
jgi:quercetin dioxygenase-like cupin family protein